MILLEDNREALYQWDLNQRLILIDIEAGTEVQISDSNNTDEYCLTSKAYNENGNVYAKIPNIYLQKSGILYVYIYVYQEDKSYTKYYTEIIVLPRKKPSNYIYTETEKYTVSEMLKDALEEAKASGEFKGEKGEPGEDAPQESVLYTSQSLTDEQQAQARENIGAADVVAVNELKHDMAGKLSEPNEGLAVGKYFRVAAIDENGHAVLEAVEAPKEGLAITPTGWPEWTADEQAAARERMGLPGDFELIEEIICDGNASAYNRSVEPDGIPYRFISLFIEIEIQAGNTYPNTFFRAFDGNDNAVLYDGKQVQSKAYTSYMVAGCDAYNGYYHGWMLSQNVASVNSGGSITKYSNAPTRIETPIMRVYVNTSVAFNAGDKIRIYGVRACGSTIL